MNHPHTLGIREIIHTQHKFKQRAYDTVRYDIGAEGRQVKEIRWPQATAVLSTSQRVGQIPMKVPIQYIILLRDIYHIHTIVKRETSNSAVVELGTNPEGLERTLTRRAVVPGDRTIRTAGVEGQAANAAHVFVHVPLPHRDSMPPECQSIAGG